jgi:hypothetical protein
MPASSWQAWVQSVRTGRFIMFSVILHIYNKKAKGPTLMELFAATGKLNKIFWQLEVFDVCVTGDTAHIDTIFKLLPHTRQHGCIDTRGLGQRGHVTNKVQYVYRK